MFHSKGGGFKPLLWKIKSLIEDLNLTSKLQYHSQPLRLQDTRIAPFLRERAADFCDAMPTTFEMEIFIHEAVEARVLPMDMELMGRALDNLLNNSVRHNPNGCIITLQAYLQNDALTLSVRDNGAGFPADVLNTLSNTNGEASEGPHILGLYLVRQIVETHGGTVCFGNDKDAIAAMTFSAVK